MRAKKDGATRRTRSRIGLMGRGNKRDPWGCWDEGGEYMGSTCDVHDRVEKIRGTEDTGWLERVLAWKPGETQSTVRLAAERRLRVLLKRKYLTAKNAENAKGLGEGKSNRSDRADGSDVSDACPHGVPMENHCALCAQVAYDAMMPERSECHE